MENEPCGTASRTLAGLVTTVAADPFESIAVIRPRRPVGVFEVAPRVRTSPTRKPLAPLGDNLST
jgi:hypothetical protein